MARRSKKLSIVKKYKNDKLTSGEFNEVVDTINDLVDDLSYNEAHDNEAIEIMSSYMSSYINDLTSYISTYVSEVTSYIESYVSPSIDDLIEQSKVLLNITDNQTTSIEGLLEQSAALLNISQNHETRISSAEELLAASQQLLNEINGRTAYDIPSTNGNVQQDIDTLLAQSAALLGVIETTKSESYNYTNVKFDNMKEYVDNSYNRVYSYVEDTTLTFTIEGIRENTLV